MILTDEEKASLDALGPVEATNWFEKRSRRSAAPVLQAVQALYEAGRPSSDPSVQAVLAAYEQYQDAKRAIDQAQAAYFAELKAGRSPVRAATTASPGSGVVLSAEEVAMLDALNSSDANFWFVDRQREAPDSATKVAIGEAQAAYFHGRKIRAKTRIRRTAPQDDQERLPSSPREKIKGLPFPAALLPESVGKPTAADRALRSNGGFVSVNTGKIDYRLDKAKRHKR